MTPSVLRMDCPLWRIRNLTERAITNGWAIRQSPLTESCCVWRLTTHYHNDLSAQIKAAEKRMAEIAVLRTHIVNYAKTREIYVAYRKAGYSKKFREEHEEEILLHQAAKNAFDEMGVKKLPKVKELQTEYAKLLEEKKKTTASGKLVLVKSVCRHWTSRGMSV